MSAITELKRMRRLFNNLNLEKSVRTKDDISVLIHLAKKKFIINVVLEIIFKNKKMFKAIIILMLSGILSIKNVASYPQKEMLSRDV